MRILYLYQYFVAREGHGMTRSYEFARRLLEAGHDVKIVTLNGYLPEKYKQYTKVTKLDIEGVPVILLPIAYSNYMSFPRRIIAFIQFAVMASWVCMFNKADLIYASSGPLTIVIPGLIGKIWQRIPMVFEVRDLWPELPIAAGILKNPLFKWLAGALEWIAYHGAAHVVALSPGMAEGVMRRGIRPDRVTVIPNSSDVDLFDVPKSTGEPIRARLGLLPDQPLVVYTGTFGLMNNVGYMVDIAVEMRNIMPECRFLLIGSGAEFEKIIEKARSAGVLDQNLFIWKPVSKLEVPAVLSAATVATSLFRPVREMWNNSANKFFDALAAGRPIAINYGGWQADLLAEAGAGISMADQDARQAAQQLAEFLSDHAALERAGESAKNLAYTQFHRDQMAQRLEALLRKVVES